MFGILLACILPFVTLVVMATIPLNPITIHSIKVLNKDSIVRAGDPVLYMVDATKHTDKPAKIIRQLVNERTTHYSPIESNVPSGRKARSGSLVTSKTDPPGEYYIHYTLVYRYFGFRDVSVSADSDKFFLVEK